MDTSRFWRATTVALSLVMAIVVGTAVVLAATSSRSAKVDSNIKVIREDSSTATTIVDSTTYANVNGAATTMSYSGTRGSLLVARFQAHGSVIETSGCIARILVNGQPMEPTGNYPFMGQANVSESVATSGIIERSLLVGPGTWNIQVQLRLATANSVDSRCILTAWHLAVERHAK